MPLPPWLTERLRQYLATDHPRAQEPEAPLWPSRKNGVGHRAAGRRYAVPLDWSQSVGARHLLRDSAGPDGRSGGPSGEQARHRDRTRRTRGAPTRLRTAHFCDDAAFGGSALHAGIQMACTWVVHTDPGYLRRLDPRRRRRRGQQHGRTNASARAPVQAELSNVIRLFGR